MLEKLVDQIVSPPRLPSPLPADPLPLFVNWFSESWASEKYADPNAMSLATSTPAGVPSVRIVLCKAIDEHAGAVTFFTNYDSRKGRELDANPRAAAVFHWPHVGRQVRLEGRVERAAEHESDEYFDSRPVVSRLGACVSPQSRPIASRDALLEEAKSLAMKVEGGSPLKRPANWGGYRIVLTSLELWCASEGRLHERVRWTRTGSGPWSHTYLAP